MAWTTLAKIKSKQYLDIENTDNDTVLTTLIDDITAEMVDYLNNALYTVTTAASTSLNRACSVQVTYEFKRRKDIGLSSTTYPDGSVNKYQIDEWLPAVKEILDKLRYITL